MAPPAPSLAIISLFPARTYDQISVTANGTSASEGNVTLLPNRATSTDILKSAGTFEDPLRYLQVFPGVISSNDESNDILVRGGNPIENLFLVDGIEVPNINNLATTADTGGFVSMIDAASIGSLSLQAGGYGAQYDERLSSIVDIETLDPQVNKQKLQLDAGLEGVGGQADIALGKKGAGLFSAHRSILNWFTNDIGLNGVPVYTNFLGQASWELNPSDKIMLLGLGGFDSIDVRPVPLDGRETSTIQMQYHGWRTTGGVRWTHLLSPHSFEVFTLSDSEQTQSIEQQDQFFKDEPPQGGNGLSNTATPVYSEATLDGSTLAEVSVNTQFINRITLSTGGLFRLLRADYTVTQLGAQSPLSINPDVANGSSFSPHFSFGETGAYAEGTFDPTHKLSFTVGGRFQSFALDGSMTATPRFRASYLLSPRVSAHFSFGRYAQLPPTIYVVSFPQNRKLSPLYARHLVGGLDITRGPRVGLGIEFYRKDYSHYPVSTQYPSLSLANMVDMLGQQFLWIPLISGGGGRAEGIEVRSQFHSPSERFTMQGTYAYSTTLFSGLDHILRRGNYDLPVVANLLGSFTTWRNIQTSARFEYTSGRPYTPYLLGPSIAQNRPIFDLSRVNSARSRPYSRLDFQLARVFHLGSRQLFAYGGLENALDRKNFLGYEWEPRCLSLGWCNQSTGNYTEADQLPRFPNFGMRFLF